LLTQIFQLSLIAVSVFTLHWRLAALAMATVPLLVFATYRLSRAVRPAMRRVQAEIATMNTVLQENLSGIRVVKAFAREPTQIAKFDAASEAFLDAQLSVVQKRALYSPAIDFVGGLGMVAILWYGGAQVVGGRLSIGDFIAFTIYMTMLLQPIRMLGFMIGNAEQAIAAGGRIFEILDTVLDIRGA